MGGGGGPSRAWCSGQATRRSVGGARFGEVGAFEIPTGGDAVDDGGDEAQAAPTPVGIPGRPRRIYGASALPRVDIGHDCTWRGGRATYDSTASRESADSCCFWGSFSSDGTIPDLIAEFDSRMPWYLTMFVRGRVMSAARRATSRSDVITSATVPSRRGVFRAISTLPSSRSARRSSESGGRSRYLARRSLPSRSMAPRVVPACRLNPDAAPGVVASVTGRAFAGSTMWLLG